MDIRKKNEILNYLKEHNDNSELAGKLIKDLESECNYADCNSLSICVDDLQCLSDDQKEILEGKFGKSIEDITVEDCQVIADSIDDIIGEEFGQTLAEAVEQMA